MNESVPSLVDLQREAREITEATAARKKLVERERISDHRMNAYEVHEYLEWVGRRGEKGA